ncbi:hypothetical protein KC19_4G204000 [Ceratodon purpureus]|uniref:Uncharacterized protein n=1 Tax=Ceratodon purpureus TaxID=3225 RepID=A0A8T0IAT2_CERPU|nr:hypothetical protein KC19_4G204000 [Ceratodon purpureus]
MHAHAHRHSRPPSPACLPACLCIAFTLRPSPRSSAAPCSNALCSLTLPFLHASCIHAIPNLCHLSPPSLHCSHSYALPSPKVERCGGCECGRGVVIGDGIGGSGCGEEGRSGEEECGDGLKVVYRSE